MRFKSRTVPAACAAALLLAGGVFAVHAQDASQPAPTPDTEATASAPARNPEDVVARVGDATITERELDFVREALQAQLAALPAEQQRNVLIDTMVGMKLLALAGRDAGLDDTEAYQSQLEFMQMQALRNAYVDQEIVNTITDAELQEAYKTLVADKHQAEEEVHARHILVETREEAEKIIADLQGGASFEELAKQSKDPSGQNGGDLGFFGKGQMVPEFETVAFALEPGSFTEEPVESQFGWHVIKVEEKRMSTPPAMEAVEEQLRTYLQRQKFETVLAGLREKYPVEVVGAPAAAEPAPAAPAEAEATPAPAAEEEAEEPQNSN
jgi:peptidyl-prolyl cis-trans isomerase C